MLHTLRWSTWLGWQIESNWADPWLFALYLIVKPITGSLVLVFMFFAARAVVQVPPAYLPYVYVSNACFGLIGTVMFGMSYVVISDRESYGMLKYIFISPCGFSPTCSVAASHVLWKESSVAASPSSRACSSLPKFVRRSPRASTGSGSRSSS